MSEKKTFLCHKVHGVSPQQSVSSLAVGKVFGERGTQNGVGGTEIEYLRCVDAFCVFLSPLFLTVILQRWDAILSILWMMKLKAEKTK